MTDVQRTVSYVGGPNGGTSSLVVEGETKLDERVNLPGGHYSLDRSGDNPVYHWEVDPQRRDRTPRDGDEASRLLADHDGATPILEQEVTSSTTVSAGEPVKAPEPQAKTVTATDEAKARRTAARTDGKTASK